MGARGLWQTWSISLGENLKLQVVDNWHTCSVNIRESIIYKWLSYNHTTYFHEKWEDKSLRACGFQTNHWPPPFFVVTCSTKIVAAMLTAFLSVFGMNNDVYQLLYLFMQVQMNPFIRDSYVNTLISTLIWSEVLFAKKIDNKWTYLFLYFITQSCRPKVFQNWILMHP